jgi:hypothetical protein
MEKVIELLKTAREVSIDGDIDVAVTLIEKVLAELKVSRWIPYKNLADAHDCMSEAIKAVEQVTFLSRDEEKRIKTALNRIECAMGAIETLIPLPLPRWETPDQWEKRTGKAWPEDWAVWSITTDGILEITTMGEEEVRKTWGNHFYAIPTEAGPPPEDWRPEEKQ